MGSALLSAGLNYLGSKKSSKKAGNIAKSIIPENIRTGKSSYNTKTGVFDLDPSIRAGFDAFESDIRGLKDPINAAYGEASGGIRDLQGRSADMRRFYEGNQSGYRDAMLDPLRSAQARREGALDRNLNRTGVKGTFAQQSRNTLAFEGARELRNAEAEIENQRINTLGDFLQIDADLLKEGLATETGRISLMASLAETLKDVSSDKFNMEMQMLGLPASFIGGTQAQAKINANAQGIKYQAGAELLGEGLNALDGGYDGGSTNTGGGGGYDSGLSDTEGSF